MRLPGELFYYSGSCSGSEATLNEIKENFVQALNASMWKAYCVGVPECDAKYVNVTCGPTTGRKRRDIDNQHSVHTIDKRQTQPFAYKVEFEIIIPFQPAVGQTDEDRFMEIDSIMFSMLTVLQSEVTEGHFDINGFSTDEQSFGAGRAEYKCPLGTLSDSDKASCGNVFS